MSYNPYQNTSPRYPPQYTGVYNVPPSQRPYPSASYSYPVPPSPPPPVPSQTPTLPAKLSPKSNKRTILIVVVGFIIICVVVLIIYINSDSTIQRTGDGSDKGRGDNGEETG